MITQDEVISYLFSCGVRVRPNAVDKVKSQYNAVCNDPDESEKLLSKWSAFSVLDSENLEEPLQRSQVIEENTEIFVIDCFEDVKKKVYMRDRENFEISRETDFFFDVGSSKSKMFIQRFLIAKAKVTLHPSFKSENSLINTIDSLIGCRGEKIVFGVLTRVDGKSWVLEDLNSSIKLEISKTIEKNSGFFCEGCVVLVQGIHNDGIFNVSCMAQPPVSWISDDPFPTPSIRWNIPWPDHSLIIVLSNVHLDDPRVLNMLDKLFQGYSEYTNLMFIFIGNFSSQKVPDAYKYQKMFENFSEILQKYQKLKDTAMWVFIPGPNDPGLGDFMPRQFFPPMFVHSLTDLNRVKLSSNPSWVSFCGKKIGFVRVDQLRKMQRTTATEPNYEENKEPEAHLAHTLIRQGHLCPSLHTQVLPGYDHALRIDQKIDFLCIAENTKSFVYDIEGVVAFNPGHFSRYSSFVMMSGRELKPEICYLNEFS